MATPVILIVAVEHQALAPTGTFNSCDSLEASRLNLLQIHPIVSLAEVVRQPSRYSGLLCFEARELDEFAS